MIFRLFTGILPFLTRSGSHQNRRRRRSEFESHPAGHRNKCCFNPSARLRLRNDITMTIQVAVLCDAATDYNGKLNLLGTFDTIYTPQLPTQHPQCSIATRIAFDRMEEGQHKLVVNFVDEDGQPIMNSMDVSVDATFPPDATFISRNFIVNIQQLNLEKTGLYSIDLSIDGRALASIPLAVKRLDPNPTERQD